MKVHKFSVSAVAPLFLVLCSLFLLYLCLLLPLLHMEVGDSWYVQQLYVLISLYDLRWQFLFLMLTS